MATEVTYGFAVVGCGVIGPVHARAIRELPNARLVVAVDTCRERAQALAADSGAEWDVDLDRVLARADVDVVCVSVPSGRHAEIGIRAARAGKHVIVEKPIDVSLAAADRLIAACHDAGVRLGVVSQLRFAPAVAQLKALLASGSLGRLISGEVALPWYRPQEYYDSEDWRGTWEIDGGGCLMNQGIHFVDALEWLMGPAESICGRIATAVHDIDVEDVAAAILTFRSGAIGVVQASTAAYPGLPWRLQVSGTNGIVRIEDSRITVCQVADGDVPPDLELDDGVRPASGASDPASSFHLGHRDQFADYLGALDTGSEPKIGGADGRRALQLVLAVYESARSGLEVALGGDERAVLARG